jgi:hypothetical protein
MHMAMIASTTSSKQKTHISVKLFGDIGFVLLVDHFLQIIGT